MSMLQKAVSVYQLPYSVYLRDFKKVFQVFDFSQFFEKTICKLLSLRSLNTDASGYRLKFYITKFPAEFRSVFDRLISMCEVRVGLISKSLLAITTEDGFLHSILNALAVMIDWADSCLLRYSVITTLITLSFLNSRFRSKFGCSRLKYISYFTSTCTFLIYHSNFLKF